VILLPKNLAIDYACRLLNYMSKDEVLSTLDIGEAIAVLGVAAFKLGVDKGSSLAKEEKEEKSKNEPS